jgi:hypothetical protein
VLAGFQILVIVLRQGDLLLVILQLQIRDIVFHWLWHILSLLPLLLAIFLLLLQLLGALGWLARKVLCADFPAQNASLCPVFVLYA